jgi:hypothetical protein
MSHAASADGLLIKPTACPAGTTCTHGHIPGKDTQSEVGQVSSHEHADQRQPDQSIKPVPTHSPSQVLQSNKSDEIARVLSASLCERKT